MPSIWDYLCPCIIAVVVDMYNLGYGVSYTELRQFLTSFATSVSTYSAPKPSERISPPELHEKPTNDANNLIVCAADGMR